MQHDPVYIFINRSWGEVEWILPIASFLRKSGFDVSMVFISYSTFASGKERSAGLYRQILEEDVKVFHPGNVLSGLSLRNRLYHLSEFFRAAGRGGKKPSVILFLKVMILLCFPSVGKQKQFRLTRFVEYGMDSCIRNSFKAGTVFVDETLIKDIKSPSHDKRKLVDVFRKKKAFVYPHSIFVLTYGEIASISDGTRKGIDRKLAKLTKLVSNPGLGDHVYYLTMSLELKNKVDHENKGIRGLYVGVPRHQEWWGKYREKGAINGRCARDENKFKILFLAKHFTAGRDESHSIQQDILQILADCDCKVVIKPHPRTDWSKIDKWVQRAGIEDYVITADPIAVACTETHVVLTLPTTAAFDAVKNGVPVVEYYDSNKETVMPYFGRREKEYSTTTFLGELGIYETVHNPMELEKTLLELKKEKNKLKSLVTRQKDRLRLISDPSLHSGEIVLREILH